MTAFDAAFVGRTSMQLGAGRVRVGDSIDPAVGVVILAKRGDEVQAGQAIAELHYRDQTKLPAAVKMIEQACEIGDARPVPQPLVLER